MGWSIQKKLGIGFLVCAALGVLSGAFGLMTVHRLNEHTETLIKEDVTFTVSALHLQIEVLQLRRFEKDILLNIGDVKKQNSYLEKFKSVIQKSKEAVKVMDADASADQHTPQGIKDKIHQMTSQLDQYEQGFSTVAQKAMSDSTYTVLKANQDMQVFKSHVHAIEEAVADTVEFSTKMYNEEQVSIKKDAVRSEWVVVLFLLGVIGAATAAAVLSIRSIVRPLREAADVAGSGNLKKRLSIEADDELGALAQAFNSLSERLLVLTEDTQLLAAGNLNIEVKVSSADDMLGHGFKNMVEKLRVLIVEIKSSVQQIHSASGQVSSASQTLSTGATQQTASLEEVGSSVSQIASQAKANAESSTQANSLALNARKLVETGKHQIETTVQSMKQISEASQHISKIIQVIDGIAFQTNLLALNAAVEAARAGQHGKGFAVVADEVRSLASRSAKAAKETAELIEGSVKRAEEGQNHTQATEETFKQILIEIVKVTDLIAEIAQQSQSQAGVMAQVTQGLDQIGRVTQSNAASSEETAAAAEELAAQADGLYNHIDHFQV